MEDFAFPSNSIRAFVVKLVSLKLDDVLGSNMSYSPFGNLLVLVTQFFVFVREFVVFNLEVWISFQLAFNCI